MSDLNADSRSPSVDLIDLHIFVVPIQSWLGKYSVAYNNVALQSTSAGFIRVYSHATLQVMRNIIAEQLETDVVPEEYVFLRSVGRCMAIVNQSQEKTLKAKHFLPPVAFSPEIFILPGSHQWIASLRKDTKSIVVNGDIALQDEYRLKNDDFYSREATDEYPYSERNSDDVVGSADQYAEKADDIPHSNRRGREPLATMNGRPLEAENETDDRDPSEMLLEKANTKKSRQHFADVVKARKKKAERVGYAFQAENGYSEEEGEEELLNLEDANFGRAEDAAVAKSQNYRQDYQDELNIRRENEKNNSKYNRQGKENAKSSRYDIVDDSSPKIVRTERDTLKARDDVAEGRVIGLRSSKSDEDDRTDRQQKHEKVVARDRSETFPRTKPAIQVLHPEVIHPTTPYAMSRATPIPSANVIHSTLTMDGYGRPSENKFLNNTTAQPSHELKSPPKSKSKQNAGTTHDNNAAREENVIAREENVVAREENVIAREENVPARKDLVTEREGATTREDLATASKETATALKESATENGDRLQVNDRYARSERSSSQRSLNAEELKRREEEKRRLEEEKIKMDEKKKNLENDTMQMMKDMEELLRQKKEEEEKRKLEEEKRKQEEKERMEQKKIEASQLREQLIKIREERLKSQKEREGLMKSARELKAKLAAKRSVEPSIWEKKYLNEKERALKLEEELNLLKSELGASQKKLLKIFENNETDAPIESKSPRAVPGPSQLNNLKNEVRRIKKEKEGVENDIERTKRKLAVESQHKAAAYQQLKDLRNLKRQSVTAKVDKDQLTRTQLGNVDVDSK